MKQRNELKKKITEEVKEEVKQDLREGKQHRINNGRRISALESKVNQFDNLETQEESTKNETDEIYRFIRNFSVLGTLISVITATAGYILGKEMFVISGIGFAIMFIYGVINVKMAKSQ